MIPERAPQEMAEFVSREWLQEIADGPICAEKGYAIIVLNVLEAAEARLAEATEAREKATYFLDDALYALGAGKINAATNRIALTREALRAEPAKFPSPMSRPTSGKDVLDL